MDTQPVQEELDFSIVSANLTIEAMRDSGYKSTDHALAELIDNSVEADATVVEIVSVETPADPDQRYARARITEIAVSDDGEGMDRQTLRRALKFGDGTRLDRSKRGIGRFGIGLPQSTVSQCRRVDVWTWQNGSDNALHCYLDLDEIQAEGQQVVPAPTHDPVPDRWKDVLGTVHESTGTLVVWSQLDRVRWRGGRKTLERTAELCGRIYRKFLTDAQKPLSIDLKAVTDEGGQLTVGNEEPCLPNDPLYLMSPSSTPAPFNDIAMFEMFNERTWTVAVGDNEGQIHVRCTLAKIDAINEGESAVVWPNSYKNPGDSEWGKHAERNKGISIVRARRELEVSLAWVNNYEPTERWWSVEVEFDPILDDIFGVVNNKQHAHLFVSGAGVDEKELKDEGETFEEFRERLAATGDPRYWLLEVWNWIEQQLRRMRKERSKRREGARGGSRHTTHPDTDVTVEDATTVVINEQSAQGEKGDTDQAPDIGRDEKIDEIVKSAKQVRVDEETARQWAEETVDTGRRVLLKSVALGHRDAFFDVESVNNVIEVWLNDQHPVHEHLIDVLTSETGDLSEEEAKKRLGTAAFTLQLLFIAWARQEDKAPSGAKDSFEDFRMDWGREARKFLKVFESGSLWERLSSSFCAAPNAMCSSSRRSSGPTPWKGFLGMCRLGSRQRSSRVGVQPTW